MDEQTAARLARIDNFKALSQFEDNAKRLNALTEAMSEGLRKQSSKLGRQLLQERTGLDLGKLSPAEERIVEAASEYVGMMKRRNKDATRTLSQLANRGLKGAAEVSVAKKRPTQGFQTLLEEDLADLSYEQIVVEHPEEFSERALWFARRTLGHPVEGSRAPSTGNAFSRTTHLDTARIGGDDEALAILTSNPNWSRDEHILGLDLYLRLRSTSYPDEHPEVIKLSETLRALAQATGVRGTTTFRNPNGVSMKMLNFPRLDPTYEGVGLPSGSKLEEEVWNAYAMRPASLAEEVERLIATISPNGASSPVSETEIANHDRLAILELRYVNAVPKERAQASVRIERGPVGKAAKRAANHRCQLCAALGGDGVGFRKPNGEPYVEAHHVMPVHLKEVGSLSCTNVMILCANHHRQLHYGRAIEVQIEPKTFQIAIDGQVAIIPRLQVQVGDDEAIERSA